jgi:hypothetical protein
MAGKPRSASNNRATSRPASDAYAATAVQPVALGLVRAVPAPRTDGASTTHNPLGCKRIERHAAPLSAMHPMRNEKGATLQHPSWAGAHVGFESWPAAEADALIAAAPAYMQSSEYADGRRNDRLRVGRKRSHDLSRNPKSQRRPTK